MASNPNVIQDAYRDQCGGQFWKRMYVVKIREHVFQVDIELEGAGIGQGHARCSKWTPNGWVLVNSIFDGEEVADGKAHNASTYARAKFDNLVDWSGEIVHALVDRALDIVE